MGLRAAAGGVPRSAAEAEALQTQRSSTILFSSIIISYNQPNLPCKKSCDVDVYLHVAEHLSTEPGTDASGGDKLRSDRSGGEKGERGAAFVSHITIPGRVMLNLWTILRHEVSILCAHHSISRL